MSFHEDVEIVYDSDPDAQTESRLGKAGSSGDDDDERALHASRARAANANGVSPFFRSDASTSRADTVEAIAPAQRQDASKRALNTSTDSPVAVKKPRPVSATRSGFQSASSLLRTESSESLARSESPTSDVQVVEPPTKFRKPRLIAQQVLTIDDDDEVKADVTPPVTTNAQPVVDFPIVPPPRRRPRSQPTPQPQLQPAEGIARTTEPALVDLREEERDEELTSAQKLKLSLDNFKYSATTAVRPTSRSLSTPDVLNAVTHPRAMSAPTLFGGHTVSAIPSKPVSKTKKKVKDLTADIELPSNDRIRVLDSCPFCAEAWPATKTTGTKSTHLRKCARAQRLDSEEVLNGIEEAILTRSVQVEYQRRQRELKKSVFDRAIGRGEGGSSLADVRIAGVAVDDNDERTIEEIAVFEMQQEVIEAQKRDAPHKIVKVAKEIRAARAFRRRMAGLATEEDEDFDDDDDLPPSNGVTPAGTGLLRHRYRGLTQDIADRGEAVLEARGPVATVDQDIVDAAVGLGRDEDEGDGAPLPATQEFRESKLASRYRGDSEIGVAKMPMHDDVSAATKESSMWHVAQSHRSDKYDDAHESPTRTALSRAMLELDVDSSGPESDDAGGGMLRWEGAQAISDGSESGASSGKRKRGRPKGSKNKKRDSIVELSSDASASSEDEPLAVVVDRRKRSKSTQAVVAADDSPEPAQARRQRRGSSPPELTDPEDSSASAASEWESQAGEQGEWPKGMPRYDEWTVPTLSAESEKYGFRPSKEKSVLVERLRKIWLSMNPPLTAKKTKKSKGRAKKGEKGKSAVKKVKPSKEEQQADALERMRDAVLADQTLWSRILRYEPVHFDDFVELAKASEIKITRPGVVKFLDENSITFYSNDPLNGSRRRFK